MVKKIMKYRLARGTKMPQAAPWLPLSLQMLF
jgi:hypothetical protein